MGDSIGGTGFHAISAEDTAVIVYVVNLGIALGTAYPVLCRVLCSLNVDTVGRAIGGTKKTGDALLQPIFISLQDMDPAIPLLHLGPPQGSGPVGIVFDHRRLEHLPEGNAHSLGDRGDVFKN